MPECLSRSFGKEGKKTQTEMPKISTGTRIGSIYPVGQIVEATLDPEGCTKLNISVENVKGFL